jgi:hypothetical protein
VFKREYSTDNYKGEKRNKNMRQAMMITRDGNINVFTVDFSECPGVGVHLAPPMKGVEENS